MNCSVIIPTLNEAENLPSTLAALALTEGWADRVEVLIADGGSQDQTCAIAEQFGAKVIVTPLGRSRQMNQAARQAKGDVLLFLHADTQLPPNWLLLVEQTLQSENIWQSEPSLQSKNQMAAGAFELAIEGDGWKLRWVEWSVKWRSRLLQLPYGDQAIFLRSEMFWQLGGFPDLEIMEDFVLVRQLQRYGRIAIIDAPVKTSARRWERLGVLKTTILNQIVVAGFYLGVSPDRLRQLYRGAGKHQSKE